jgi:hypothetical protein
VSRKSLFWWGILEGLARKIIFSCRTTDGKTVVLYQDRYDNHIVTEHPELLRDYDDPANQIEYALTNADKVVPGKGKAWIYISGPTQANPPAGAQRISIVIRPESERSGWWVVTAYAETILSW